MKFSLAWQASDNVNYYATASEGFRANDVNRAAFVNDGVSTVDPTDTVIPKLSKPDTLWNYEAGMKGQWDTISANVAVYKMVWEDIQLFASFLGRCRCSKFGNGLNNKFIVKNNSHFMTMTHFSHCFADYVNIFKNHMIQTFILRF